MTKTVKQIGRIGVDAGLCWIGDPCYILHAAPKPKAIGDDWGEFCDIVGNDKTKQFHYDLGHAGLGVVVTTGHGDGTYPVFAEVNEGGTVTKVWVEFLNESHEDEELSL